MRADDGGGLKEALILGRQAVYPGSEDGLYCRGNLNFGDFFHQFVGTGTTSKSSALDERLDAFFEIEWVALRAFNEECF